MKRVNGPLSKPAQDRWQRFLTRTFTQGNEISPPPPGSQIFVPTVEAIEAAIKTMSPFKAPGPDGISAYHLKQLSPMLIQEIFIGWAQDRMIPNISNASEIVPIYKSGEPSKPTNYRPISLINTIVKLYELTILHAIENRQELIAATQYGAMRGRSALLQYEQLISAIDERLSRKEDTWLLLVDFSKAFDSVNREIIIQKLARCVISTHILNAIALTQTNQYTRIIGTNMEWIPILRGVRQGSPLGPFLFNIYVNDIRTIANPPPRMYLDDMAFIIQYYHRT